MWQGDILTFRLAGKNAYLIGYIDDYSRYIAGLGFYIQTAENVIETYRRAVGGVRRAQGDTHRQRLAVYQLARHHPV